MQDVVTETIRSYDRIAGEYCRHTLREEFRKTERRLASRFLGYMGLRGPVVADVGCGDGRDGAYLVERGARVLLIDLSRNMLAHAARNVPDGRPLRMDVRCLGLQGASLDGLWASGVLYHLPKSQIRAAMLEIHRVTRPGGVFSFNFKVGTGEGMEANPRSYPGAPRYYAYYTFEEICTHFGGFTLLGMQEYPNRVFGDTILHMWLRRL